MASLCENITSSNLLGPFEVFSSLGHWNTAVYAILVLHLLPVLSVSTFTLSRLFSTVSHNGSRKMTAVLICIPPALMLLSSLAILFPSLGTQVEVLLEIVICIGLVSFVQLCINLCSGVESIVHSCSKTGTLLPIGAPPFICLLPCRNPTVSKAHVKMMLFAPCLLLLAKVVVFIADLVLVFGSPTRTVDFFSLSNIHNLVAFPVGLVAIYFYTMFNILMNSCLQDNSKRFLGVILLAEFVLFDCLRLFFIFLTGTGMLTCVPPFLSQDIVVHLLKNYIKAFLATGLGLPFLKLCSSENEVSKSPTFNSELTGSLSSLDSDESQKMASIDVTYVKRSNQS